MGITPTYVYSHYSQNGQETAFFRIRPLQNRCATNDFLPLSESKEEEDGGRNKECCLDTCVMGRKYNTMLARILSYLTFFLSFSLLL